MEEIPNGYVLESPNGHRPHKPNLKFEDACLWVEFDHELSTTIFLIRPESELYFGLHFIPKSALAELTYGLKACAESEEYTDAERDQIQTGVERLERFIATGER